MHALPITLMNIAQVLSQAQLCTMGTPLDAPSMAAVHMIGLVAVQAVFLIFSPIRRYALATPDVTVGLLNRAAVNAVYLSGSLHSDEAKRQTALAAIGVVTLVQASCYLALGGLRASELIQYLPFPVVCAVLGVTGISICHEALGVAGISGDDFAEVIDSMMLQPAQLLATLTFALGYMGTAHFSNSGTSFLLVVPTALLLFWGAVNFNATSEDTLVQSGWLFERTRRDFSPVSSVWWTSRDMSIVMPWLIVPDQIDTCLRCVVSLMTLVLKVIAIEGSTGIAVDLDAELTTAGIANLVCAALGGSLANHSALYVAPLRRAGVAERSCRVAIVTLLLTVAVLASSAQLMDWPPRFLLGGLLLALGLQMCIHWVWTSHRRMDRAGYTILGAVLLVKVLGTTKHAFFLAILAAVGSSLLRTSRLNALRYHLTGASMHAPVSRAAHAQIFLERHGHAIHLFGLDGFLFEGSTARLLRQVLTTLRTRQQMAQMQFLVLDMTTCQGAEPAACDLLGRTARALTDRGIQFVLAAPPLALVPTLVAHSVLPDASTTSVSTDPSTESHLRKRLGGGLRTSPLARASRLTREVMGQPSGGFAKLFSNLDGALEWCEETLLARGSSPSLASSGAPSAAPPPQPYTPPTFPADDQSGNVSPPADDLAIDVDPPFAPFAPSGLAPRLAIEHLLPHGEMRAANGGEVLTTSSHIADTLYVAPPSGVAIEVLLDVGGVHGHVQLAVLRHGGVFGADGALLGVPSMYTARVKSAERGAQLLVISGTRLQKLRTDAPLLHQKLLATSASQKHGVTALLARRALLWRGAGWQAPNHLSRPVSVGHGD